MQSTRDVSLGGGAPVIVLGATKRPHGHVSWPHAVKLRCFAVLGELLVVALGTAGRHVARQKQPFSAAGSRVPDLRPSAECAWAIVAQTKTLLD